MTQFNGHVHWYQGLFMRPQHMQHLQRQMSDVFTAERELCWAYPYGVIDAELAPDALAADRVQFTRLRAVMRSGVEVSFPGNARVEPLDISRWAAGNAHDICVHLAVPNWYADQGNVVEAPGQERSRRYQARTVEMPDENNPMRSQTVHLRQINAYLMLDDEPSNGVELLPLLRIARAVTAKGTATSRLDPEYFPPTMVISGWRDLYAAMRSLTDAVEAARKEVWSLLSGSGGLPPFSFEKPSGAQLELVYRLRTLNHYASRLGQMVRERPARSISPFSLYLEMRGLLGELAALEPSADHCAAVDYDHDNLGPILIDLTQRIRTILVPKLKRTCLSVTFTPSDRLLVGNLGDEHILGRSHYLRVRTADAAWVQDQIQFRLIPKPLVGTHFLGLKLIEERTLPAGLPMRQDGQIDFRVDTVVDADSRRLWHEAIVRQPDCRTLAIAGRDRPVTGLEVTMLIPI